VARFGPEVLLSDGTLDRQKLGDKIFSNPVERRALTAITNRYIMREIVKSLIKFRFQGYKHVVLDAPLLFEAKVLAFFCYPIIVIYVGNKDVWLERLCARDSIDQE
jgi:dephospho-CoA kinase